MGVGGQCHALAAFTPGKDAVPIVQEAGWAPGPVWIGAENLAPTGIRSPDLPARKRVAIPTELSGPIWTKYLQEKQTCYSGSETVRNGG